MRKTLCLVTIIFVICSLVKAQTNDCTKFKNGVFKMSAGGRDYIITRTGSTQSELLVQLKATMVFNVKWIDDCTYTLIPTESVLKSFPAMPKNTVMTVKITKTTKNSYTQITTANTTTKTVTSEMIKIK